MRSLLKISVLLLLFLFLLPSCSEKPGGNADPVSQSIQSVTEPDNTADSETEEAVIWPWYKMGDLPEPAGTILSVTDDENGVHAAVEGMSAEDAEGYVQSIKELGYSPVAEGNDENGGIIFSAVREDISVVFMFDPSGGSSADASLCQITFSKKA